MSKKSLKDQKKSGKTGPKPETLKIEGEWENAVEKALEKKRPTEGWPKTDKKNHP